MIASLFDGNWSQRLRDDRITSAKVCKNVFAVRKLFQ